MRRTITGHHVGQREANVFQAQGTQGLEAEYVTDQGGHDVYNRTFLEQVDRVGNEGVEAGVIAWYVLDRVGTTLVVVQVGQQVGPYCGPGTG